MARAWDSEDWEAQGRQEFAQEILDLLANAVLGSGSAKRATLAQVKKLCADETSKKI